MVSGWRLRPSHDRSRKTGFPHDRRPEGPLAWSKFDRSGQSGWLLGDEVVPGVRAELRPGAGQEVRGFSVHAGVLIPEYAEVTRERLIRYACRPPFAADQVRLLPSGQVAFTRRSPKPSGETHIFFEPIAFVRRLTSQIPPAGHCPRGGSDEPYRRAY